MSLLANFQNLWCSRIEKNTPKQPPPLPETPLEQAVNKNEHTSIDRVVWGRVVGGLSTMGFLCGGSSWLSWRDPTCYNMFCVRGFSSFSASNRVQLPTGPTPNLSQCKNSWGHVVMTAMFQFREAEPSYPKTFIIRASSFVLFLESKTHVPTKISTSLRPWLQHRYPFATPMLKNTTELLGCFLLDKT